MMNFYNYLDLSSRAQFKKGIGNSDGSPPDSGSKVTKSSWLVMLLMLISLTIGQKSFSQSTANYAFTTATNGSLALDQNGNAIDLTSGTTALVAAVQDQGVSAVTNIGFNFVFMGNTYSQFSASSNGILQLGSTQVSSSTYVASGGTSAAPKLSALGSDAITASVADGGGVVSKLIGTAPNRCLVVQWKEYSYWLNSASPVTFQVRLYETSGVVQYAYGNMPVGDSSYSSGYSIGFSVGTAAGTLLGVTASTNLVSTTAITANFFTANTNMTSLHSTADGSRRLYTFTPPTATPSDPTTLTFTSITGSTITPNWVDNSTNETLFLVTRATDASFTQNVVNTVVSSTTGAATGGAYSSPQTGLLANVTYYFKVQAGTEAGIPSTGISGSALTVPVAYTAAIGGLWSSPATWTGGVVPTAGNDITIPAGVIITVDQVVNVNNLTINGLVQWNGSSNAMTVLGNLVINSGGSFLPYTTGQAGQTINIAGNFQNDGYANLALISTLINFNGTGSTLSGTGVFQGDGTNGIIRTLAFQNTGSNSISTTQNLIVTNGLTHTAGSLNTNGKVTINNTAQVYGQALNLRVANVVVTAMGTGYTVAPVVFGVAVTQYASGLAATLGTRYVSGNNVYLCTTAGTFNANAPTSTNLQATFAASGPTLLYIGTVGTLGTNLPFNNTLSLSTVYFHGGNMYQALATTSITSAANMPVHTSGVVNNLLYLGPVAKVSVNFDATTGTVRSLNLTQAGSGFSSAPALVFSVGVAGGAGSAAAATPVFIQQIAGPASATFQKSGGAATLSGGLTINSDQGASIASSDEQASSGVGALSTSNGGVNYTVAPTVGFALPTAINLIQNPGSGYTTTPTVTVTGGNLVSGTALTTSNFTIAVNNGKVQAVYLNTGTSATYSTLPTLTLTTSPGVTATLAFPAGCLPAATANITNGQITSFTVTNAGFGYIAAPTVGIGTTPGTANGGTFSTVATAPTARVALYNLTLNLFTPSTVAVVQGEDAAIPSNRKINTLTLGGNGNGLTLTSNLVLYGTSPLSLTASLSVPGNILDLGGNNLLFTNNSYGGTTGTFSATTNTYVKNGSITLTGRGGPSSFNFPFAGTFNWSAGSTPTSVTTGSTVTRVTVTETAAPSNTTFGTGIALGTRAFRAQYANIGRGADAVLPTTGLNPTVTLNFNSIDALTANTQDQLLLSDATSLTGPWNVKSVSSGSGAIIATTTGSRTTATTTPGPIAPTGDNYYAWSSSAPTITDVTPLTQCQLSTQFTVTGTNLTGVSNVQIGGTPVTSFVIASGTTLTGVTGTGTTGYLSFTKNGYTFTGTQLITVNASPGAPSISGPATATINLGGTYSFTATGDEGATFNWYTGAIGGSPVFTGATYSNTACSSTTLYVSQNNGACDGPRTPITITVNPTVITASTSVFCGTGGDSTLTVTPSDSSITYTWSTNGTATFSSTTGESVVATLTASSDITVTATSGSCSTTAVSPLSVYPLPNANVTTTASGVCPGTSATINSGLSSEAFSAACISAPTALSTAPVSAVTLINGSGVQVTTGASSTTGIDDNFWSVPIGFSFNYLGTNYTSMFVSTNGIVSFISGTTSYSFPSGFPSTSSPAASIAVCARDMYFTAGSSATLKYWVEGIAPNRKFIVQYANVPTFDTRSNTGTTLGTNSAEAVFYETLGNVDIRVINANNGSSTTGNSANKLIGLQNAAQTIGAVAPRCTPATVNYWNAVTTEILAPQAWRFSPPANFNITWSSVGPGNVLTTIQTGVNNFSLAVSPSVTTIYNLSYTNQTTGCTNIALSDQVTMQIISNVAPDALAVSSAATVCLGSSATLSLTNTSNGAYKNSIGSTDALTYQWQVSTDAGASWNDIAGATAATATVTPTAVSQYRCNIKSCTQTVPTSSSAVTVGFTNVVDSVTNGTRCGSGSATISATTSTAGASLKWYAAATGGTALSTGASYTTTVAQVGSTATVYTYYVAAETTGPACSSVRVPVTITVNPAPVFTLNQSTSQSVCAGGSGVTLTSSDANFLYDTFTITPTTGATLTNDGTTLTLALNPTATTTYTLLGTQSFGDNCGYSIPITVTVNPLPIINSVAASPAAICLGNASTLTANLPSSGYTFAASTGATLDPMAGATTVLTSSNDDTPTAASAPIGFNFSFNGTTYTDYSVSPDGWILLGTGAASNQYTNAVTSTTNVPKLYPYWDDLATGTDGNVKTLVTGTAGNRILKVQWQVTVPRNTVGASDSTFQAWLYEATGKIEYRYGTMGAQTAGSASAGYTVNATNYSSITFSTNGASTTTANDSNAATPAVGTMYTYSPVIPGTITWSPTTGLYTDAGATTAYTGGSAATVYANPASTTVYYATATNSLGCSTTDAGVTVTVNTDPVAEVTGGATSICLAGTAPDNDAQTPSTIDFDTTTTGVTWQSSNPAVATIDANGVLTPLSAGTTNIRAYIYNPGTGCTTYSPNTVAVNVYAPIKITLQPNDASALAPASATFTVGATGSGLTYQWQSSLTGTSESFVDISGETAATLSVSGVNTTTYYRCKVSGSSPCTSPKYSDAALLTVTCLAISTPASQSVCQNNGTNTSATATLTATITGATPDVVLWQVNDGTGYQFIDSETFGGLTYSGFDTNTLVISGLTAAQSGYTYKLSAAFTDPDTSETCETTSGAATVTVNAKAVITSVPTTNAICYSGGTTSFNVSATGATGYQWNYFNGTTWAAVENNVPEGVTYSGASTASLTIVADNTVAPSNYLYQVVLSSPGNCETTTSGTYTYTSNTPTFAATITSANTSFCSPSGAPVALAVAPTGTTAASTYVWSTVPSSSFTATGATINVSPSATTVYSVTGTDATGCTGSTTISVVSSPSITATLAASANTVCPDASVTITASALDAGPQTAPTGYASSNATSTADEEILNVTFGSLNNSSTCSTTGSGSSILNQYSDYTSLPAPTVAPGATVPISINIGTCGGNYGNFTNVYIDYNRNGVFEASEKAYTSSASVTGPHIESGSITIPSSASRGVTRMRVFNIEGGSTTSSPTGTYTWGETEDYNINIQNDFTTTSTYSWSSVPADATLASETGSSITRAVSANTTYTVSVVSPGGCASTGSTTITTQSGAAITTQPVSTTVCQGVTASFTVAATGPGLTYQWSKNGAAITGNATATTATLTLTGTTPADNGVYTVTVHPICGDDAVSDGVATLLVNPTPTAVAPSAQTLCSGVSTAFALNGTPSGVTFDITGGTTIGLANQTGVTSIPSFTAITGTATLTITPKANGCAGTPVTVVYTVNQTPSAITITPSSSTVCSAATSAVLLTAAGGIVPPSSYCVPTVGSTGLTSDNITNVTYAGINNTTGDGPGDYNYYSAATATVVAGVANTLSITPNSAFGQQFRVWIDMNQNGVFESSESIAATTVSTTATVTASVTVPTSAYNGTTRMRVADKFSSAILATEACGHTGYGEFEDYNVTISGATPKPSTVVWSSSAGGLFTDAAMTTPYTGAASGTVYAKPSATATITATSTVVGCSSSATTTVAVVTSTTTEYSVTACGSYNWSLNGATYTTSGDYTYVSGCATHILHLTIACSSVVTVNMFIEGYYDATTHAMRPVLLNQGSGTSTTEVDEVTVELHDATTQVLVESTTAMLQTNGVAVATFSSRTASYYIVVKYRNSLETWSANPVSLGATASYNFTDAASKAYGNNMKELESGVYGFYSGDINQDGFIEASDYAPLFNDNDAASEGYLTTDLNGDGFVEAGDYPILFNNSDAAIELARP